MCKKRYAKSKQVENIAKILSMHTKTPIGTVYKKIIWPLYDNHEHALDALKEIFQGDTTILDGLKLDNNIKDELLKIIKERLSVQPFKIRADFKLTCYQFEGIEAIKKALISGEKKSTKEIQIKFNMIGSPLYECSLITTNKKEGIEIMNQALNEVHKSIKESKGDYILMTPPKMLGEHEKNFSEQLKEANNNEEEEETEEEKNEEGINPNLAKFDENEFNINKQ
jgi:translation initiation factor 2 subunit 1